MPGTDTSRDEVYLSNFRRISILPRTQRRCNIASSGLGRGEARRASWVICAHAAVQGACRTPIRRLAMGAIVVLAGAFQPSLAGQVAGQPLATISLVPTCGRPGSQALLRVRSESCSPSHSLHAACKAGPKERPLTLNGLVQLDTIQLLAEPGSSSSTVRLTTFRDRRPAACIQLPFTIKPDLLSPWNGITWYGHHPYDSASIAARLEFYPDRLCGFPAVDTVHLIQTIRMRGYTKDSVESILKYSDTPRWKGKWAALDHFLSNEGMRVDVDTLAETPYMTALGLAFDGETFRLLGEPGVRDTAWFIDGPMRCDENFPVGIVRIELDFEVNAFATSGAGKGFWLGRCGWVWSRVKGKPATIWYVNCPDGYALPTSDFMRALWKWRSNPHHALYRYPWAVWPSQGGRACN